jgi:arylsulfatase A-like enzyme
MKNHVKCVFDVIAHLVNKLQDKGVYDATTIIVAGDHGINYPSAFVSPHQVNGQIEHFDQVVTQANALLMLKPENAHFSHLTVSELPVSTADITQTICAIAHLDCRDRYPDSLSLLEDARFPPDRVRFYAHHGYGAENAERYGMDLYAVQGELWNVRSWRYVAHLPGKGGGSGNLAREQLAAYKKHERENSAQ